MATNNRSTHPLAVNPHPTSPDLYKNDARLRCACEISTGPQDGIVCNALAELICVHCRHPFCTSCAAEFPCFDSPTHKHAQEQPEAAHVVIPLAPRPNFRTVMAAVIDQITRRAA